MYFYYSTILFYYKYSILLFTNLCVCVCMCIWGEGSWNLSPSDIGRILLLSTTLIFIFKCIYNTQTYVWNLKLNRCKYNRLKYATHSEFNHFHNHVTHPDINAEKFNQNLNKRKKLTSWILSALFFNFISRLVCKKLCSSNSFLRSFSFLSLKTLSSSGLCSMSLPLSHQSSCNKKIRLLKYTKSSKIHTRDIMFWSRK